MRRIPFILWPPWLQNVSRRCNNLPSAGSHVGQGSIFNAFPSYRRSCWSTSRPGKAHPGRCEITRRAKRTARCAHPLLSPSSSIAGSLHCPPAALVPSGSVPPPRTPPSAHTPAHPPWLFHLRGSGHGVALLRLVSSVIIVLWVHSTWSVQRIICGIDVCSSVYGVLTAHAE